MNNFDVIIVGGGMVGLVLALLLAECDFQVVLIENQDLSQKKIALDRVSAINVASKKILKQLNLWPLAASGALEKLVVWDGVGSGRIEFSAADIGLPLLGSIIVNGELIKKAWQRLSEHPHVQLVTGEPLALNVHEDCVTLKLQDERVFQAALCVGADGAHSFVREHMPTELKQQPYQQQALTAVVTTQLPHQYTGWQIFLPEGPLAFLPLADVHQCAIVWSMTPAHAQACLAMDDASFMVELNQAFGLCLGEVVGVRERQTFSLVMRHVTHYAAPHLVLVGDAAHTIHPLAGQGVNLGLLDALCLADQLKKARQKNQNIGLLSVLRRYERARKGDNTQMILLMRCLNDLFRTESSLVVQARSFGLNAVNHFSLLKNYFIGQAIE